MELNFADAAQVCNAIGINRIRDYLAPLGWLDVPNDPVQIIMMLQQFPPFPKKLFPRLHPGSYAQWLRQMHICITLIGRNEDGPVDAAVDRNNNAVIVFVSNPEIAYRLGFPQADIDRINNDDVELRYIVTMTAAGQYREVLVFQTEITIIRGNPRILLEPRLVDHIIGGLIAEGCDYASMYGAIE